MPMSSDHTSPSVAHEAGLALRLAQRAFSALIDACDDAMPLARAQRGQALQRALSALSADDRDRFARWLALLRASRQGLAPQWIALGVAANASPRRAVRRAQAA